MFIEGPGGLDWRGQELRAEVSGVWLKDSILSMIKQIRSTERRIGIEGHSWEEYIIASVYMHVCLFLRVHKTLCSFGCP